MKNVFFLLFIFSLLFNKTYSTMLSGLIIYSNRDCPSVYVDGKKTGQLSNGIFRKSFKVEEGNNYKIELKEDLNNGSYYYYSETIKFSETLEKIVNADMELFYTDEYFTEIVKKNPNSLFSYSQYLEHCPNGKYIEKYKQKYNELKKKSNTSNDFVLVEGGTFYMGNDISCGDLDEYPKHKVSLNYNFFIAKCETSQKEYFDLTGENPSIFKDSMNLPVENITWWDAIKYCNILSEKDGLEKAYDENTGFLLNQNGETTKDITTVMGYRLPTEAEWEFAAMGGSKACNTKFSGSNIANEVAWFYYNSDSKTHPVANLEPNELGIYDMSGNVLEWCTESFQNYNDLSLINPYFQDLNSSKAKRGGSWKNVETRIRIKERSYNFPWDRLSYLGFRVVRTSIYE